MPRHRKDFLVKLPNGNYVTLYARFKAGPLPQYQPLQDQPGKLSAVRMSFNVAQAVARRGMGIVVQD